MSNNSTETMMRIFYSIRQYKPDTEPDELPASIRTGIEYLSKWYRAQQPATDEAASVAVDLLELLSTDAEEFWDRLGDMLAGDDLPPLQPLLQMPAIFADAATDAEETEGQ